jgi:hypothetical protein
MLSFYLRSWKEPWSCIINEFKGEARAVSRVVQKTWDVWQSTTRCNTSVDKDDRITLIIN